jgi:hypothetical protein
VAARALSDEGDDPGSLIGWTHLSARGRRRPNRTSGAGDGRIDKRSRRRAGQGGRRWVAAGLENNGGGRTETISRAEIK